MTAQRPFTRAVAKEVIRACENVLGWVPPRGMPLSTARTLYAAKLEKAAQEQPGLVTERNLLLAVELCRRERTPIQSPMFLCHRIKDALRLAASPEAERPLGTQVDEALTREGMRADDESSYWRGRLMRASGNARAEVLQEWREARGTIHPEQALLLAVLFLGFLILAGGLGWLGGWIA